MLKMTIPVLMICALMSHAYSQGISAIWANDGGDKVHQGELRVGAPNGRKVLNSIWDGEKISLKGAKNEVIGFNLVIEAMTTKATGVKVEFNSLIGPGGAKIESKTVSKDDVFDWVGRPIELFYIRYLEIKGLSWQGYSPAVDERQIPYRLQVPWTGDGVPDPDAKWVDRPDHNAKYPDIVIPIEAVPTFDIEAKKNQSIWGDIYIPRDAAHGMYTGVIKVTEGTTVTEVPIELKVYHFEIPDTKKRGFVVYNGQHVNSRYIGSDQVDGGTPEAARSRTIQERHFLLAHRHRIALIGDGTGIRGDYPAVLKEPSTTIRKMLKDETYTEANGYEGPFYNKNIGLYCIGTYTNWEGIWGTTVEGIRTNSDIWVNWMKANAPETEYMLYLGEEDLDYAKLENWANGLVTHSGPGKTMPTLGAWYRSDAQTIQDKVPSLSRPNFSAKAGDTPKWVNAVKEILADPVKDIWVYNGRRPGAGSFMTEDDGVALRVNGWIQFKMGISYWWHWGSTYYKNQKNNNFEADVFNVAHTIGHEYTAHELYGEKGQWNYSNGDGLLFYPGTDKVHPNSSYDLDGPIASLRLKLWRRGLQDQEYLHLAEQYDSEAVWELVNKTVPNVLWETGVGDPASPTWVKGDLSWSIDPDVYEGLRDTLAMIINDNTPVQENLQVSLPGYLQVQWQGNSSQLLVEWANPSKGSYEILLTDAKGKKITSQVSNVSHSIIDMNTYPSGLYLVHVKGEVSKVFKN